MSNLSQSVFRVVHRLIVEKEGATATEYAVILGVIIAVVIAGAAMFGTQFSSTTSAVYSGLSNGTDAAGSFGPGSFRSQTTVAIP